MVSLHGGGLGGEVALDALDNRCEVYDGAFGTISEHLQMDNPLAAELSAPE